MADDDPDRDFDPDTPPEAPQTIVESWWRDFIAAAAFLTSLPLNRGPETEAGESARPEGSLASASRAFPLVGFLVGLVGALALAFSVRLGLGPWVSALLALAATIVLTGGLHEDGLADAADGLAGGRDREARLSIMRDARIGAFAVLALLLSVLLRAGALATIAATAPEAAGAALMAAAAGSRATLPAVMERMPLARGDGLAVAAGRPPRERVITAALLGAAFVLLFLGPLGGAIAVAAAAGAAAAVAALARARLGGYTGDVLGAAQQAAEIAILVSAVATA